MARPGGSDTDSDMPGWVRPGYLRMGTWGKDSEYTEQLTPAELQRIVIEHSVLVGKWGTQPNPNRYQWKNKQNAMEDSPEDIHIRGIEAETRLLTRSGGAHFMPTEQPAGGAGETDGSSVGEPTDAECNKPPRCEANEDDVSAENGSVGESQDRRRSSVSAGRSKKGDTDESDAEESAENGGQTSMEKGGGGCRLFSVPGGGWPRRWTIRECESDEMELASK